eukprot:TRINITY_DN4932_c0_g2_i2.p1 TRINITY_DN4932_c0_g2~~TRINITY_DN4932_c0_g2_i2.p1  ORF type:complete len:186 (+),score=61.36 TRINITY_DN4932_c0_g2_i2:74-559(+)
MAFSAVALPYAKDALAPFISAETVEFHYEKHHKGYVAKLNDLTKDKPEAKLSLEELVKTAAPGPLFNNAAQAWNHNFYWLSMCPKTAAPPPEVAEAIKSNFGSMEEFKKKFSDAAIGHFGSGWCWLVQNPDKKLQIVAFHDADTPLKHGAAAVAQMGAPLC